jgi:hypothetical protein
MRRSSNAELRPIYHHTDPKVRAHVTICRLALLLGIKHLLDERTMAKKLAPRSSVSNTESRHSLGVEH